MITIVFLISPRKIQRLQIIVLEVYQTLILLDCLYQYEIMVAQLKKVFAFIVLIGAGRTARLCLPFIRHHSAPAGLISFDVLRPRQLSSRLSAYVQEAKRSIRAIYALRRF